MNSINLACHIALDQDYPAVDRVSMSFPRFARNSSLTHAPQRENNNQEQCSRKSLQKKQFNRLKEFAEENTALMTQQVRPVLLHFFVRVGKVNVGVPRRSKPESHAGVTESEFHQGTGS